MNSSNNTKLHCLFHLLLKNRRFLCMECISKVIQSICNNKCIRETWNIKTKRSDFVIHFISRISMDFFCFVSFLSFVRSISINCVLYSTHNSLVAKLMSNSMDKLSCTFNSIFHFSSLHSFHFTAIYSISLAILHYFKQYADGTHKSEILLNSIKL